MFVETTIPKPESVYLLGKAQWLGVSLQQMSSKRGSLRRQSRGGSVFKYWRTVTLRIRETECADSLLAFLKDKGLSPSYFAGDDPPDFVFKVNNEVWAVEHTRLIQRIQGDSKPVSKQQCETEDFKCRRRILTRLGNLLRGSWYLHFEGPFNNSQYKMIEDAVCTAISSDDPNMLLPELQKLAQVSTGTPFILEDSIYLDRSSSIGSSLVCGSGHRVSAKVPSSGAMAADILATNTDAVEHMIQKKSSPEQKWLDTGFVIRKSTTECRA